MDAEVQTMIEEAYSETVAETLKRDESQITAHKEGVVAAAMLLSAVTGVEDAAAHDAIVALRLRP